MTNSKNRLIFTFFILFILSAVTVEAGLLCDVPKNSNLAMDQRDDLRMSCLKQKKTSVKFAQCLSVAKSMEYSTNAEDTRIYCLQALKPTLKECFDISKSMEYADSGDEVRWECLNRFNGRMTIKQCQILAKGMSYPANHQRALIYCAEELR